MFTIVNRRKINRDRQQETMQRAQSEFFPKLQSAAGLVGFYLVNDEENGVNTAIVVWEDRAHADAFRSEGEQWAQVLDEFGHTVVSDNWGETVVSLEGHARTGRP